MATLTSGARLGSYEIVSVLGAGGMGEVYRARDTKLGREVAIKVILEAFAADADRVARFEREAKVLASLNHPHIAALYGMEHSGAQHFLVMELVEGQTLADRLARGALPVEETLAIAVQIAEALEAAHEKGVVHRDLKPANIKVTPDDRVKVLDFGLAKAVETQASSSSAANSPTLSMMASQAGIILGTAAYMSPEQAKGFPADHRSDIFSFGSVVFEMLTGRQPFQGETAPEVLASVLVREPDINRLPPDLNPRLAEVVRRCLEKHPKRRWQAIGDVRAELESIAAAPRTQPQAAVSLTPRPIWKRALVVLACSTVAAALAAAATWTLKPDRVLRPVRFSIVLPEGQRFTAGIRRSAAISPDGATIAYLADNRIYVRAIDALQPTEVPGTQSIAGPVSPVFSPDGRSLAYVVRGDNVVKRVPLGGGPGVTLYSEPVASGIGWNGDTILIPRAMPDFRGVVGVHENGGPPRPLVTLKSSEVGESPQLLPDGKTVLLTVATGERGTERWEQASIVAFSLKSGERKVLVESGSDGRYLPTGHLLYARAGTVLAIPFDVGRLATNGTAVQVIEGVRRPPGGASGLADYATSANGTLVYVPGPVQPSPTGGWQVVLADEKGTATPLKLTPGPFRTPRAAPPDGARIALESDDGKEAFIGIYDVSGATALRRLTDSGKDRFPVWSPDGRRIAFQSERDGDAAIFWQPADGGAAERLTKPGSGERHVPQSWSGDVLLFDVVTNAEVTLWTLSVKDRKTARFGSARSTALTAAVFSPDGRWVAYNTFARPGGSEVYVEPYPATGTRQVLIRGTSRVAHHPLWSPDSKVLYYVPSLGVSERVTVSTAPSFAFGNPEKIVRNFQEASPTSPRMYDMMPDGRFLSLRTATASAADALSSKPEFVVVLNWFEELKAKVPR
jgi:Tol biopolymer transport system component